MPTFEPDYTIKQYDTARSMTYTLSVGDVPVDLSTSTASLIINTPNNTTVSRSLTVGSPPSSGSVTYDFVAADVSGSGLHRMEFKVVYNDGTTIRIPSEDYIYLQVNPALV